MKKEYADKMAELCRQEEEAKKQVQFYSFFILFYTFLKQVATWEQMYNEWMATMEKRVHNLQINNQQLNVNILFIFSKSKESFSRHNFVMTMILVNIDELVELEVNDDRY
jgi:hypothetical protein